MGDDSGRLISTFIQTVIEFKAHVTNSINQIDQRLQHLENVINAKVESEVESLRPEIADLKNKVSSLEKSLEHRTCVDLTASNYPRALGDQNPFANQKISRNIMPPPCKEKESLQFRWNHYKYLCKEVLQKLGKPYKEEYLFTFKKNSITYATTLVDDIRATHQLDPTATWSDLSDKIRREAEVLFEDIVGDEFPLKACVERWGARLVMRKAFLKREKVAEAQNASEDMVGNWLEEPHENTNDFYDAGSNASLEHGNASWDQNLLEEQEYLFYEEDSVRFDTPFSKLDAVLSSSDEDEDMISKKITSVKTKQPQHQTVTKTYGKDNNRQYQGSILNNTPRAGQTTTNKSAGPSKDTGFKNNNTSLKKKRRLIGDEDEYTMDADKSDDRNAKKIKKKPGRPKKKNVLRAHDPNGSASTSQAKK